MPKKKAGARGAKNVYRKVAKHVAAIYWADHARNATSSVYPDRNAAGAVTGDRLNGAGFETVFVEFPFAYDAANAPALNVGEFRLPPPDDSRVLPFVRTKAFPDGAAAIIEVFRTSGGPPVQRLTGLEVRNDRVIDPATGAPPVLTFRAAENPWSRWDAPYFRFHVLLQPTGGEILAVATSNDPVNEPDECLRVTRWHTSAIDSHGRQGYSARRMAARVTAELNAVAGSEAFVEDFAAGQAFVLVVSSVLRNTYSALVVARRRDRAGF